MDPINLEIVSILAAMAGVSPDAMPPGKGSPEMAKLLDRTRFGSAYGGPHFRSAGALSQWIRYRLEGRKIRGESLRRFLRLAARNAYVPGVKSSLHAILAAPEAAEDLKDRAAGFLALAEEYSQDTATQHAAGKKFFLRHLAADVCEHQINAGAAGTRHSIRHRIVNVGSEPLMRMSIPAFFDARLDSPEQLSARTDGPVSVEIGEFSQDRCLFSIKFREPLAFGERLEFVLGYEVPGEWSDGGSQEYVLGVNVPMGEMRFLVTSSPGGPKFGVPVCDRLAALSAREDGFTFSIPYPEAGFVSFKFEAARKPPSRSFRGA